MSASWMTGRDVFILVLMKDAEEVSLDSVQENSPNNSGDPLFSRLYLRNKIYLAEHNLSPIATLSVFGHNLRSLTERDMVQKNGGSIA